MTIYTLPVFDMSWITTSNPAGFDDNGGFQFVHGVDTVTILSGAVSNDLSIADLNDDTFDDDQGAAQVLNGAQAVNGVIHPDGTIIEAEYVLEVKDAAGTSYGLQFVSLYNDATTIHGFTVQGPQPPRDTPLTIANNYDAVIGYLQYATATPACFDATTLFETERGPVPAARLHRGDKLLLAGGGSAELRLCLRRRVPFEAADRDGPVRLRAGALGPGRPARDLVLSPQHRVFLPELDALVPARGLLGLPRIGLLPGSGQVTYVHLVTTRHVLLRAEGLDCESFWPGPVAMAGLPPGVASRVRGIMGQHPVPAARFLSVGEARRRLAACAVRQGPRLTAPSHSV